MTALDRLVSRRDGYLYRLVKRLRREGLLGNLVESKAGSTIWANERKIHNFTASNNLGLANNPQVRQAIYKAGHTWGVALGQPRLWATDPLTPRLEGALARLSGQERALIFPSTMQIACDLIPLLAGKKGVILIDEKAYPISKVGARLAAAQGGYLRVFRHNDPQALAKLLEIEANATEKVIVCDGLYPERGAPARLREFQHLASQFEATIYVDDAQGFGLLGKAPHDQNPYGSGGGGSPRYWGIQPGRIVQVSTLAKSLGVPVAFAAGPRRFMDYLEATAFTFIHSSPPALPVLAAALETLQIHRILGDALRSRLLVLVRYFQRQLGELFPGQISRHPFPMQTIYFSNPEEAEEMGWLLWRAGIWAVIQFNPDDCPDGGVLRFILTVQHHKKDIDRIFSLIRSMQNQPRFSYTQDATSPHAVRRSL